MCANVYNHVGTQRLALSVNCQAMLYKTVSAFYRDSAISLPEAASPALADEGVLKTADLHSTYCRYRLYLCTFTE